MPSHHRHPSRSALPGTLARLGLAILLVLVAALLGLFVGRPAHAADGAGAGEEDPPARVGRVVKVEGYVTLQGRDSEDEVDQPRNWPLTRGDLIRTGDDARAELRVGPTLLRLGSAARLRVLRLDDDGIELELLRGSVAALPPSDSAARELTLVTRQGRFFPLGEGFFRIDAQPEPGATAWRNGLRIEQSVGTLNLRPGQYAELYAEGGWRLGSPVSDDFAHWAMQAEEPVPPTPYVSPEVVGAEDLARHGDWQRSEDWGPVWFPRDVDADWAPYREGRWAWVAPWGWTWVDDAPWGFAPFHYGRWVHWRGRWGWVPGDVAVRPVYAPALVAWADEPPPASVSISFGRAMVWFPLGPREVYVPAYRCSPRHREFVNLPVLRQPLPREEQRRFDHGPRHVGPPVYRYAQLSVARTVLPRTVFEQARRPVDAQRRREIVEREQRERRTFRPGTERGDLRGSPHGNERLLLREVQPAPATGAGRTAEPMRREVLPPLRDHREDRREERRDDRRDERRDDRRDERRADPRAPGGSPIQAAPAQTGSQLTPRAITQPVPQPINQPATQPVTQPVNQPANPAVATPGTPAAALPAGGDHRANGRGDERGRRGEGRAEGDGRASTPNLTNPAVGNPGTGNPTGGQASPAPRNPAGGTPGNAGGGPAVRPAPMPAPAAQAPAPMPAQPAPVVTQPRPAPQPSPAPAASAGGRPQARDQQVRGEQRQRRGDEMR